MRSVSEVVDHFKESWISELSDGRIEQACHDSGMNWISSLRTVAGELQSHFASIAIPLLGIH